MSEMESTDILEALKKGDGFPAVVFNSLYGSHSLWMIQFSPDGKVLGKTFTHLKGVTARLENGMVYICTFVDNADTVTLQVDSFTFFIWRWVSWIPWLYNKPFFKKLALKHLYKKNELKPALEQLYQEHLSVRYAPGDSSGGDERSLPRDP